MILCNISYSSWLKMLKCLMFLFKGIFSDVGDDQLDELVCQVSNDHPNFGVRMIKGQLPSKGCCVQCDRIHSSLLRTDPIGLMQCWQKAIKRSSYNVKFPRLLWHTDGNHNLIR